MMGTQKSNMFDTPYKYMVPDDETLDRPLPFHWNPSMQAYNNYGSTPTPFLNQHSLGPYMPLYMWPNQTNSTLLQSDALHDPMKLSSKPTIATGDAVLAFSEIVHRNFGEQNLNSIKKSARNLQTTSSITKESRENRSKSSILKTDRDGVSCSVANGNKGSPDEDHDSNNGFPLTEKLQCDFMLENASSTKLNQNLETGLGASGTNAQFVKLEKDEIRKERKRQSNRESARRSRMRKEKECEELNKNMEILKDENSMLTQRLKSLSEDCLELCNENDSIQIFFAVWGGYFYTVKTSQWDNL